MKMAYLKAKTTKSLLLHQRLNREVIVINRLKGTKWKRQLQVFFGCKKYMATIYSRSYLLIGKEQEEQRDRIEKKSKPSCEPKNKPLRLQSFLLTKLKKKHNSIGTVLKKIA